MNIGMFSLFIYILIYIVDIVATQDPCNNYNVLNDYKRSAAYERTGAGASISLCDNLLTTGWYRSTSPSGPLMPNACPALYRCGSDGSIWMDLAEADMPTSNNTKTAQACLADLFDCCSKTYSIDIKNCNDEYYIYKLIPTSGCPEAYCFGTEAPCSSGQSSETGYTPGCGVYPMENVTGTVIPALRQVSQTSRAGTIEIDELTFECNFTLPPSGADYVYDVYWYINDKDIPIISFTKEEPGNIASTLLLEEHWTNTHKMNMVITCSTRVRYNTTSAPSPHYWSNDFEAGLKAEKAEYSVEETKTITIPFHLTVPLGCRKETVNGVYGYQYHKCTLNILTAIPTYQSNLDKFCVGTQISGNGLAFKNQLCGLYFNADNWTATTNLEVTGDIDNLYNSNKRIAYIRLVTQHGFIDIWKNITIPDIKVNIIDTEVQTSNKQCMSVNDPHITPFDYINTGYYDHFIPGEYVVYKHDVYPIQVNAIFRKCNTRATCNCGVAVKNADGLFVINMCPSNLTVDGGWGVSVSKVNRYVEKKFCDDTHMTLTTSGNTYTINLPTGTRVVVNAGSVYINSFTIKASVLDLGHLTGLCGPYGEGTFRYILSNKSETTDINVFNRHYYVPQEESLFALNWTAENSDSLYNIQEYCVCKVNATSVYPVDSPYILCNLTHPVQKCTYKKGSRDTFYTQCSSDRRKRSASFNYNVYERVHTKHRYKREVEIENDSIEKYAIQPYDISTYVEEVITWKNGWTEITAYTHCEQGFNQTSAFTKCTELVPGINVTAFIQSCMLDIKIGGDDSWLKDSLNAYKTACKVEAVMMEPLREKNTSSSANTTFLDEILEASCANDCSGHGQCIQGECQCDVGYIQEDCSKEANSAPDVAMNSVSGHCDTNHRACNKLVIPGYGFNPDGIKCAFRKIQVTENGSTIETNKMIMDGEYVNQFSCQCSLPSRKKRSASSTEIIATGYMISVANGDGSGTYTDEITFLIYNSDCYECNISSVTCIEKSDCPTTISSKQSTTTLQQTSTESETSQTSVSSSASSTTTTVQTFSTISSSTSVNPSTVLSTSTTSSSSQTSTSTQPDPASSTSTVQPLSTMSSSTSVNPFTVMSTSTTSSPNQTSTSTQPGPDPCSTYTNLTGDVTRSVAWVVNQGDIVTCDAAITEQWYRIVSDAGNDMVTSCPPTDRCGTHNPIWLNGSLSSYADGIVERDACVSDIFSCCSDSWKIKLKNCGSFMLYYLPQSSSCPQAYCFGTLYITTTSSTITTTTTTTSSLQTTTIREETESEKPTPEDKNGGTVTAIITGSVLRAVCLIIAGIVAKIIYKNQKLLGIIASRTLVSIYIGKILREVSLLSDQVLRHLRIMLTLCLLHKLFQTQPHLILILIAERNLHFFFISLFFLD